MKHLYLLLGLLATGLTAQSAGHIPTHVDVFTSGTEGYHTFRIPALVTAPDGTLLAFVEGRKDNRHDPGEGQGDIDLLYKSSTDQGKTWSSLKMLDDPGVKWAASNPTPVVDKTNGRVWIVFNRWEPGFGTRLSQAGTTNSQTWARHSDDNGKTWSAPVDITTSARDFDDWGSMFPGPGGAIQTRNGRLMVPAARVLDTSKIWVSSGDGDKLVTTMRSYAIYSDDHGKTWRRGELLHAFTDECQFVELADGAIMIDARQNYGDHRWVAIS